MYANITLKMHDLAADTENVCDFCADNGTISGAKFGADLTYEYKDEKHVPHPAYNIPYWVCRNHLIALVENYRDMDR